MADELISESIYTDENWLQAYKNALSNALDEQIRKEQREYYSHETQAYPDYLDYVEEWEYATKEMIQDVRKSYILRMASKNLKMKCDCGEIHTLSLYPRKEETFTEVDNPKESPWDTCWFRTIDKEMRTIRSNLKTGTAKFPSIVAKNLTEIVRWKIAKTGRSPTLLPYETYKEVWWDLDINGNATQVSLDILRVMSQEQRNLIVREKISAIKKPERAYYFFTTQEIIQDHAFHLFCLSQTKNIGEVLKFMNYQRRECGWWKESLKYDEIQKEINQCEHCKKIKTAPNVSIFGIYCAPPGAGKTTAMKNGLLVGFDTDWIGIGPTWRDYSMILRRNIPIITNQTRLFQGSGIKINLMLKQTIRKDAKGKPMGNYQAIKFWAEENQEDVHLMLLPNEKFVSDYTTQATIVAHMQNISVNLFMNRKTMWDVNDEDREMLNEFGRKMKRLATGIHTGK